MFNVYKLTCNKTKQDYYGSTELTVERRLGIHESHYKSYLEGNYNYYCSSFEIIKNNDYKIELLEECDDEPHMCDREDYYIISFPCVNIRRGRVPGRTNKEWRETFKEEIKEYEKQRYEANKEKILENRKEYRETFKEEISEKRKEKYSCECGSIDIRKDDKARHERSIKHKKYLENLNNDL